MNAIIPTSLDNILASRQGRPRIEINQEFEALAKAMEDVPGKGGSVTITFKFVPEKADENAYSIDWEVAHKAPKKPRPKLMVYLDKAKHAFTRTDPAQLEAIDEAGVVTIGQREMA